MGGGIYSKNENRKEIHRRRNNLKNKYQKKTYREAFKKTWKYSNQNKSSEAFKINNPKHIFKTLIIIKIKKWD